MKNIYLIDEEHMINFLQCCGCRIMQIFHNNFNKNSTFEEDILNIYNNALNIIKENNFDINYRYKRECLMLACEGYSFVIPEADDVEIKAYNNFIIKFLAKRIKEEIER